MRDAKQFMTAMITALAVHASGCTGELDEGASNEAIEGRLELMHFDDEDGARSWEAYHLMLDDGRGIELALPGGDPPAIELGARVRVRGTLVSDELLEVASVELLDHGLGSVSEPLVTGQRRVAAIMITFRDDPTMPITAAGLQSRLVTSSGSVHNYFQETSHGQLGLTGVHHPAGDVYGWYTIDHDSTGCLTWQWALAARAAAAADGFVLSAYDHVIYVLGGPRNCSWSGLATLGGNQSWVKANKASTRVIAHELGHNLGLHHASSVRCKQDGIPVVLSDQCSVKEYGDPFDNMGGKLRQVSAYHKARLGWIPAANVRALTKTGTYTLLSAETAASGSQALTIPYGSIPGAFGDYSYSIEYRRPYGRFDNFAETSPVVNGVSIRLVPSALYRQTRLLDMTPETSGVGDGALVSGNTFLDPRHGVQITTVSASPSELRVHVVFP
jgi:hypothetical protein